VWDAQGRLLTHAPSTYKIPTAADIPEHFTVRWWPFPNRVDNVGGSKAVGEPPLMLALSVIEALRDAVACARQYASRHKQDVGRYSLPTVDLDAPATPERVFFAVHR